MTSNISLYAGVESCLDPRMSGFLTKVMLHPASRTSKAHGSSLKGTAQNYCTQVLYRDSNLELITA